MEAYLKGYYGYKNFGDELLLLGLLSYLHKTGYTKIIIETPDPDWLCGRCNEHKHLFSFPFENIHYTTAKNTVKYSSIHKIFGGGEVITDARPFPYNGWNYLLGYAKDIIMKNYSLYGGVGTSKKFFTPLLYKILLGRASSITLRDSESFDISARYSKNVQQYHDFAYDVLGQFSVEEIIQTSLPPNLLPGHTGYGIINITPYLWNSEVAARMSDIIQNHPHLTWYFFPGEIGVDDEIIYDAVSLYIPQLQRYDWTKFSLEHTLQFLSGAQYALATRLHVLLCLHRAGVAYTPLVYQEKIRKLQLA